VDPQIQSNLRDTVRRVDTWILESDLSNCLDFIPFNPLTARKALQEMSDYESLANFKHLASLFEQDPGLQGRLMDYSRQRLADKNKNAQRLRNLEHAVSILGVEQMVQLLEYVISDEIISSMTKTSVDWIWMHLMWKESWGVAYGAEAISEAKGYDARKAFQAGIMADIGLLIFGQAYQNKYFLKVVPMLQKETDDPYEIDGEERILAEKRTFGVSHAELSCWVLSQFGMDDDYLAVALCHEEESSDLDSSIHKNHRLPLVANTARRIARYGLMDEKFQQLTQTDAMNRDQAKQFQKQQEAFERRRLKSKFALQELLMNRFMIHGPDAAALIHQVVSRMDRTNKELTGKGSALKTRDFEEAIRELAVNKGQAIQVFRSYMEKDLARQLPYPVARPYQALLDSLQKKRPDSEMVAKQMAILVPSLVRLLCALLLGFLYDHHGFSKQKLRQELHHIAGADDLDRGQIRLGSRWGVSLCKRLAERLVVYESANEQKLATPMAQFVLKHADELSAVAQLLREANGTDGDGVAKVVPIFGKILRGFSKFGYDFKLVSSVSYNSQDQEQPLRGHMVSWMGHEEFSERTFTILRPRKGFNLDTAEFGTLLRIPLDGGNNHKFIVIREFLVRLPSDKDGSHRHFFAPDKVVFNDEGANGTRIQLTPFETDETTHTQAHWWPAE
jgi:HD-like signal output (HDOD) protein